MLLIADSGSTKTDWRLIDKSGDCLVSLKSKGLNPYFLQPKDIKHVLLEKIKGHISNVNKVVFYGAGCGHPVKAAELAQVLNEVFPTENSSEVNGDILGAARSLHQHEPGIACILGTGSNSCLYDGKNIIGTVPSLGFILGDQGSGTVLGRDLIRELLQSNNNSDLREEFFETYQLDQREILDKIYNQPRPNRFLASFTPFLLKHASNPVIHRIIYQNFRQFFDFYILPLRKSNPTLSLKFTGSVAFHFAEHLSIVAQEYSEIIELIEQSPMEGLKNYHSHTFASF
ncbi:N-acetylglucosamine kinase-like BadF-type ATPase [Algoriphagus iocasae]|jgi:glucosamine kinase|uniref:N-acetylglucosamine kinase-like BadF-type ATPase n=1 Tax=Algoriphagus iocasae TaxID=1836499 RepID=A0A841MUT6_9BACT|nr:N-acetylglucosamine kinase [Algoriphagus iocasae]MBB6325771.1 N-acetylglucosamine kinase-like BadF-type ATPase [Algoriphagus iocasae]